MYPTITKIFRDRSLTDVSTIRIHLRFVKSKSAKISRKINHSARTHPNNHLIDKIAPVVLNYPVVVCGFGIGEGRWVNYGYVKLGLSRKN